MVESEQSGSIRLKNAAKKTSRKIAVVCRALASEWQSARTIRNNLTSAYRHLGFRADVFEISYDQRSVASVVSHLARQKYDLVVIPESMPVPVRLLYTLAQMDGFRPELHFHLYGDFSLNTMEWNLVDRPLRQFRVRFYVASNAQAGMVSEFMKKKS